VAKLGERLYYASLPSVSKPFQKYHRKAREGRSGHLDDKLVVESVAAMRLLVNFLAKEAAQCFQRWTLQAGQIPWRVSLSLFLQWRASFGGGFSTRARYESFNYSYLAFRDGYVFINSGS
jgi:hypothetical protein